MSAARKAVELGVVLSYADGFLQQAAEVKQLEHVGADIVSLPEAYSFDAVSQLGYLAAITERIRLTTGIMPLYSRTPALIAMTAAGLDYVSGGRFELGLGSSGPQVIEGFHGVPFTAPLGRLAETVEICRLVWRRELLEHHGRNYTIPLTSGTGLGRALKLVNHPLRADIPITLAALTPRGVAQTAEIANGWLPLFYWPEKAEEAWGKPLAEGLERRDSALGPLTVIAQAPLFIGDEHELALLMYRNQLALYVGGMGARGANFYNDLARSYGYGEAAELIQDLYLSGKKDEAAEAIPEDLVRMTALIGDEAFVRERVAAYRAAGVTRLSVQAIAGTAEGRTELVETLAGMLRD